MNKSFKYRLAPTVEQEKQFIQMVGCTRFIYNWGLARWKELYESGHKPSVYGLSHELVLLKKREGFEWLNDAIAQSLQQSLSNLGEAFSNFFKKKSKHPQFKKKGVRDSFRIPQHFEILEDIKQIKIHKVGLIKYRQDRPIEGSPKSITIMREGDGWYACVLCEMEDKVIPNPNTDVVGLDVGVTKLFTTWDGEVAKVYQHQPSLKKAMERLTVLQKQLSHKVKGSKNRLKARLKVAKQHKRITDIRKDTLHKVSTDLAKNHGAIVVEDLVITNMTKSASGTLENPGKNVSQKRGLNRSIQTQGWGAFVQMLTYKTKWYGSVLCLADPQYTSQTCPKCFHISRENRKTQSRFHCVNCEFSLNADIIAAMNIRRQIATV